MPEYNPPHKIIPRQGLEKSLTPFGRLANSLLHDIPYIHGGFSNKKYISKYIKINKMGVKLRSIFWPVLQARGSKIRILMFGYMELDPPPPPPPPKFVITQSKNTFGGFAMYLVDSTTKKYISKYIKSDRI